VERVKHGWRQARRPSRACMWRRRQECMHAHVVCWSLLLMHKCGRVISVSEWLTLVCESCRLSEYVGRPGHQGIPTFVCVIVAGVAARCLGIKGM
jgi:hypothetical protein